MNLSGLSHKVGTQTPTGPKCSPRALFGRDADLSSKAALSTWPNIFFTTKRSICYLHMVWLKSQHLKIKQYGKNTASAAAAGWEQQIIREAESPQALKSKVKSKPQMVKYLAFRYPTWRNGPSMHPAPQAEAILPLIWIMNAIFLQRALFILGNFSWQTLLSTSRYNQSFWWWEDTHVHMCVYRYSLDIYHYWALQEQCSFYFCNETWILWREDLHTVPELESVSLFSIWWQIRICFLRRT